MTISENGDKNCFETAKQIMMSTNNENYVVINIIVNYCYVRNYWKKLQLNIARLCCHNFLSLVVFWLGGARAHWPPPPGYAYVTGSLFS